jgi:hypothetical protein
MMHARLRKLLVKLSTTLHTGNVTRQCASPQTGAVHSRRLAERCRLRGQEAHVPVHTADAVRQEAQRQARVDAQAASHG